MNEATHSQSVNLQLARVYLTASEPKMTTRTWLDVAYAVFLTIVLGFYLTADDLDFFSRLSCLSR